MRESKKRRQQRSNKVRYKINLDAPSSAEYVFSSQRVQALAVVAPLSDEYVPAKHDVHPVAPVVSLYLPATQVAHSVRPVFAAEVPAGHEVQEVDPVSEAYLPALQSVQLEPV